MATEKKDIKNPLQLLGLYLVYMEAAGAASMFAMQSLQHWTRYFLIFALGIGILIYLIITGFVVIYLTIKHPHLLFNPSDYAPGVQHRLFDETLNIDNPPILVSQSPSRSPSSSDS